MRGVDQYIIFFIGTAILHFLNLVPDGQHHLHEVIQFGKAFALRRFNHQCAVYREGEGGGMIAVVHQTLGDVIFADTGFVMQIAAI